MFWPIWAANVEDFSVLYTEIEISGFPKNLTFSTDISYTKGHHFQNISVLYTIMLFFQSKLSILPSYIQKDEILRNLAVFHFLEYLPKY